MRRLVIGLTLVLAGMVVFAANGMRHAASASAARAMRSRLEIAVAAVEANLDALQESGYARWTPSAAAAALASSMTAAETLTPEERAELGPAARVVRPTQYVVGKATAPGQVVLVPDDRGGTLTVEGYGTDLGRPWISRRLVLR